MTLSGGYLYILVFEIENLENRHIIGWTIIGFGIGYYVLTLLIG